MQSASFCYTELIPCLLDYAIEIPADHLLVNYPTRWWARGDSPEFDGRSFITSIGTGLARSPKRSSRRSDGTDVKKANRWLGSSPRAQGPAACQSLRLRARSVLNKSSCPTCAAAGSFGAPDLNDVRPSAQPDTPSVSIREGSSQMANRAIPGNG